MGHRRRLRDHVRTISADHSSDCDGRLSRHEEEHTVWTRNFTRRHLYLRMSSVWHDRNCRCAVVPAGGRARTRGGPLGADSIRRIGKRPNLRAPPSTPGHFSEEKKMAAATPIQSFETPDHPRAQRRVRSRKLFEPELVREALKQSFIMLRPDIQWSNPVMFVVEIGAVLTLLFIIQALVSTSVSQVPIT